MPKILVNAMSAYPNNIGLRQIFLHMSPHLPSSDQLLKFHIKMPCSSQVYVNPEYKERLTFKETPYANNRFSRTVWEQTVLPWYPKVWGYEGLISASSYGPRFSIIPNLLILMNATFFPQNMNN